MRYCVALLLPLTVSMLFAADEPDKRIRVSAEVLSEIMHAKDKGIPEDLLEKSQCVGIIPDLKRAGFIVGAKYGKGVVVCRTESGWSAPANVRIEGGSIGLQIGAGETDVVFLLMNRRGMNKLEADKFTFGADASVMAGPVGRTTEAQTDALMNAEILSWSRARGIFAGISIDGATLRPERADNRALYGRDVTEREILEGQIPRPSVADPLYAELSRYRSGHTSARN